MLKPPSAKPGGWSELAARAACCRRSANMPPCTSANSVCSVERRAVRLRRHQAWVRSSARSASAREASAATHSSRGMMRSAPSRSCASITHSGVSSSRLEAHPEVGNFAEPGERKDLIAAAVGQDRAIPPHERVQPTELFHAVDARRLQQVVGIGQDDSRASRSHIRRRQRLDGPARAHGHERRRLHRAVRRLELADAQPGAGIHGAHLEPHRRVE